MRTSHSLKKFVSSLRERRSEIKDTIQFIDEIIQVTKKQIKILKKLKGDK